MRKSFLLAAAFFLVLTTAGCGVNFYSGRASDAKRIEQLSSELNRLASQKEREAGDLEQAKALLERKLRREISDSQVKLEMAERGLVLTFVAEVLFDSGQAKLRSEAQQALAKVASVISEKVSDRDIGIEGHTDNEPITKSGWKSNWELSTARAISVLHFLEGKGVIPNQMVASGYGEYRPVISNETAQGRKENRRVEIVILPKQLSKREKDLVRQGMRSDEPDVYKTASAIEGFK
jgi:chemotaxis protein MotB